MADKETGFFKGAGGVVWEMDLPLPVLMGDQLAKQELVRVNADGSPYTGGPTPIVGGGVAALDAKDAEIARLRARVAELESPVEPEDDGTGGAVDLSTGDIKRPALSATKADWVAYAVSQGMTVNDAESLTKSDLVERFGGGE